jgi:soluble lytic murein transglycosylase
MEQYRKWRLWIWIGVLIAALALFFERWASYREHSQDANILAAAQKYGMDPSLIKAVVWRESRFNPRVRGKVGEVGLMQVGKLAGQEWARAEDIPMFSHDQLFDPAKNIEAGTWYLRKALRRYGRTDYPARYALADYNAGRANVLRWTRDSAATNSVEFLRQMDFPRTREYVLSILKRQPKYQKQFGGTDKEHHVTRM